MIWRQNALIVLLFTVTFVVPDIAVVVLAPEFEKSTFLNFEFFSRILRENPRKLYYIQFAYSKNTLETK